MIKASFAKQLSKKNTRKTEDQLFLQQILDEISRDIIKDAESGARVSVIQFGHKVLPSSFATKIEQELKNNDYRFQFVIAGPYVERLQIEW